MSEEIDNLDVVMSIDRNIKTSILHIFKVSGEELNLANKIDIDIVNVGTEGIKFKTFFFLENKMNFYFELVLDEYTMYLVAEIIGTVEAKDDYMYTCKYMHLASSEKDKIIEYIKKYTKSE